MEKLIDKFKRQIDYLRLSVTDRCNLRCIYCMPEYGILQKEPAQILTFEEITRIVKLSVSVGINKIKITGGEPLARKDLPQLLESLSSITGLKDLSLTTNGIFLKQYISRLKSAGLRKLNISIDSLDEQKFQRITRGGRLTDVLEGIDAALRGGFFVKINVVIMKGINDDEILDFIKFAKTREIILRFIELMPISDNGISAQDLYISCAEVKEKIGVLGALTPVVSRGFGNGPAKYYKIEDNSTVVGFISPISCRFCLQCNRLRLTASGLLMPCLASDNGFDLKTPLREDKEEEILDLLKRAVSVKPQGHNLAFSPMRQYFMSQIGG